MACPLTVTRADLAIIRHRQTLHAQATTDNHAAISKGVESVLSATQLHAQTSKDHHITTMARLDSIRQHQDTASKAVVAATQNTIQAGFQDMMTTLRLTFLEEDKVLVEGDNLAAGVTALQYLNKHLAHSLRGLADSDKGLVIPADLAAELTGEIDKIIRYSQRCGQTTSPNNISMQRFDDVIDRRIHTVPIRTHYEASRDDGFITIDSAEGEDVLGRRVQYIRFVSFSVKAAIVGILSRTGLAAHYHIERQLRVINIVSPDQRTSQAFVYAFCDDVQSLKAMFVSREASVLDYQSGPDEDTEGRSLLWVRRTIALIHQSQQPNKLCSMLQ